MVMLVLKGQKAMKIFGAPGTWYCPVKQCKLVGTTDEIEILDKSGELAWAKMSEADNSVSITPLCPFHGVPLDFHSSTDLVRAFVSNKQLALPSPKPVQIGAHLQQSQNPLSDDVMHL